MTTMVRAIRYALFSLLFVTSVSAQGTALGTVSASGGLADGSIDITTTGGDVRYQSVVITVRDANGNVIATSDHLDVNGVLKITVNLPGAEITVEAVFYGNVPYANTVTNSSVIW